MMKTFDVSCPADAVLSDFGLGKLDQDSADHVSQHIEICLSCRDRVANISGDSFVDLLRGARTPAEGDRQSLASTTAGGGIAARKNAVPSAPATQRTHGAEELPVAFGRYQVKSLLGEGGFGYVYLGDDPELERSVAIKTPRQERVCSALNIEAFLTEARLVAALEHRGILPVYDVGRTEGGVCYLVSQYVPGGDLRTLFAEKRLSVHEAVELTAHIAEALHFAHEHGLVHRDVKPSNILLDRSGNPLLADFGLALTDESYGRAAGVFGTPAYMSPEQARGESHIVDARSDIYSLGVVFYELLTGRRPYRFEAPPELLEEISSHDVRPPRQLDHTLPMELEQICLKALAKRPADRYTTAFDMASELRRWQASGETTAILPGGSPAAEKAIKTSSRTSKKSMSPRRKYKLLLGCGGLLTISVTATVAVLLLSVSLRPPTEVALISPKRQKVAVPLPALRPTETKLPVPPKESQIEMPEESTNLSKPVPNNLRSTPPAIASTDNASSLPSPAPAAFADRTLRPVPSTAGRLVAKEAFSLKQHTAAVTRVVFHRTLPLLASAGKDGQVLLWDVGRRGLQLSMHKFREEVWAIKFSPDGTSLALANRNWWGSRLFFKTLTGQQLNEVNDFKQGGGAVASIAYSPDGRLFAAGQDDGTIRLWDIPQFSEITAVGLGEGHNVYGLAFGPVTIDRKDKRTEYLLAEGGRDGVVRTLAATLSGNDNAAQWTFAPTAVQFPTTDAVNGLRFSRDGKLLGFTCTSGHVTLCDPRTGQTMRDLAAGSGGGDWAEWIAFHPQKPWCVTAHKNDQVARIWNTDTAELLTELRGHTGGVMCAEFSPDGRQVATASEDFSIKLWDLTGPDVPTAAAKGKKAKMVALVVGE